jgi:hypothetical protein
MFSSGEHSNKVLLGSSEQYSPDIPPAGSLILDFSASRAMKIQLPYFVNYPVCGILLQQHKRTKTEQGMRMCLKNDQRQSAHGGFSLSLYLLISRKMVKYLQN